MFRCGICKQSSEAREKARRVIVEWREMIYPPIPNAHRCQNRDGMWKTKDDPGGVGWAITKEMLVCSKHEQTARPHSA
jgi:hypothetical protein